MQQFVKMAGKKFISKEKFSQLVEQKKEDEKVVRWTELDREEIFKIITIETKLSKYGECWLTTLEDSKTNQLKIFAPAGMIKKIKKDRKDNQTVYFMCLGQELNRLDKTKRNRYDLIFEEESNVVTDIFIGENEMYDS